MSTQPHYGGSLTPSGRLGRKPAENTQFRVEVLLERLVRFDLAKAQGTSLMSDDDIARVLNRSKRRLNYTRGTVPYLKKRMEILTGISTDAADSVNVSISKHKQMLELAIPDALRVIMDTVRRPITMNISLAEKKFVVETARDILDRQGSFPRISRTDAHVKHEHNFAESDEVSRDLLDSLDGPVQSKSPTESILQALAMNEKFSKSDTLSSQEMEASLVALEAMPLSSKEIN